LRARKECHTYNYGGKKKSFHVLQFMAYGS
jgi:hypothetical protein